MNQFMDCLCDANLQSLVASGSPKFEDMCAAWATVFYEYCDLVEATETKYRVKLKAKVQMEKVRLSLADGWIKILSVFYVPVIAENLKEIGFDYDFNPADERGFAYDIAKVKAEIISGKFNLRVKEAELEHINETNSTKSSVDRKYFATIFFRINNYAKREAVNGLTMVADYCAALKDYVAYIDQTKQNLRHHGV